MALSLGYRERIILDPADVEFASITFGAAGIITAMSGDIKVSGLGYGNSIIKSDNITYSSGTRSRAEAKSKSSFSLGSLVADSIYNVIVYFETDRYQAEIATDYIRFGRPVTIQVTAGADAAATNAEYVATVSTLENRHTGRLPFNAVINGSNIDVTSNILGGRIRRVTTRLVHSDDTPQGALFETADISTVITTGSEGVGTGKYVEENTHFSTRTNRDPYGPQAYQIFDLAHGYAEFNFTQTRVDARELSVSAAGGVTNREHKTTLFVSEAKAPGQPLVVDHPTTAQTDYSAPNLPELVDLLGNYVSLVGDGSVYGVTNDTAVTRQNFKN